MLPGNAKLPFMLKHDAAWEPIVHIGAVCIFYFLALVIDK